MRTNIRIHLTCALEQDEEDLPVHMPRGPATPLEDVTIVLSLDGRSARVEGTMVLDDASELIEAEEGQG